MTAPARDAVRDDRRSFLRCRQRAFAASGGAAAALGVLACLFVAPNRLASLRVGDVALAWWVAGGAAVTGLVALSRGFRGTVPPGMRGGMSRGVPLALAAVWGSPALWLGLPPLLLSDGTRGLWAPAAIAGGAIVALLLLGTPWIRTGGLVVTASALARARWPASRGCHAFLVTIEAAIAGVFVWAQLAAVREVGASVGSPVAATVAVTVLVVGALLLPDLSCIRLTAFGGGLALVGLAVPLAVIAVGTTPAWPTVWSAVASRVRIGFGEDSRWIAEGGAVRGPAATLTLTFSDEQRVTFSTRGVIVVEPREGGRLARDVQSGEEIALHPGDRLVIPAGFRLRFDAGRRVPDAPDSGPEWVEPSSRATGWPWLVALGVTGFLGALGLPAGSIPVGQGRLSPGGGARLTAVLVISGVALAVAWSLYAAWLTPEVYVGGVTGVEVFAMPSSLPASRAAAPVLTWLVFGGLVLGGAAAALGGARGLLAGRGAARWPRRLAVAVVASAGALSWVPVGPWTLLVVALGLGASALAPTAVLACWSERATAEGAAGGAGAGLLVFLLVVLGGVAPHDGLAPGAVSAVAATAAAFAAPVHLMVAGFLRSRGTPSPRAPLPPGLEGLSTPVPARTGSG